MAARLYFIKNGASAAAAAPVKVTTGTAIKTMLQVLHATDDIRVVEWGISFDGTAANTPIEVELCSTGTVAATVTAAVANDITLFSNPAAAASGLTLSTTGTGYTASGEGTVIAPVRSGDLQLIAPTSQYIKQFPLGREFEVLATHCLRIRVTAGTAVSAYCYCIVEI